ncbi:MAG: hypothetical protein CMG14_04255 [Candidatus Marinimicrobia bacterium]|nr:hypothetical protein [Candidatus Neomarinimicrobiota bacterium]|tara:strand:- start:1964 stop:3205 length:1242 start_codon:yes stop_codon:yes gene_type:complete
MNISNYLLSISSKKIKYGLKRTKQLLSACNNPHKKLYSIQIAGTNGKGSVSALLSNILAQGGYKVGLFSSPHLVKLNERIRINNQLIQDNMIKEFVVQYQNDIKKIEPSFFELLTVIAVWYFNKQQVNFCILETGLGGKFDSVTACQNQGIVYTPISMDHHFLLGNTLSLISADKAKAINKNTDFIFSSHQPLIAKNNLIHEAKKQNLIIKFNNKTSETVSLKNLYGTHQIQNAALTKDVVNYLNKEKIINMNIKDINMGIENTVWHGRFQILNDNPLIIFDVAHNQSSLECFINSFNNYINKKNINKKYLLCAFERNKKIKTILKKYEKKFDQIICSETNIRDSMPAKEIAAIFTSQDKTIVKSKINKAMELSIKKLEKNDILVIIGSHFLGPSVNSFFKNCFALDYKRLLT